MAKQETPAPETTAPEGETKRQAFVRIATRRVQNISAAIKLLHGLSNKANYDFTEAHVEAIFAQVEKDVAEAKAIFKEGKKAAEGFQLSE